MEEYLKCKCGEKIDFSNYEIIDNDNLAICRDCYEENQIHKTLSGISYKIVKNEKWVIHKETKKPIMLLKEYQEKLLKMLDRSAKQVNKNIPLKKIEEILSE